MRPFVMLLLLAPSSAFACAMPRERMVVEAPKPPRLEDALAQIDAQIEAQMEAPIRVMMPHTTVAKPVTAAVEPTTGALAMIAEVPTSQAPQKSRH